MLNQSVDLDYITSAFASRQPAGMQGYDDIDSITEYVIEQIMDDEDYIPEQQGEDDNGMPKNKSMEKFSWNPLCCQFFQKVAVTPTNRTDKASQTANQQDYPTCKGYFNIVSPPPEVRLV